MSGEKFVKSFCCYIETRCFGLLKDILHHSIFIGENNFYGAGSCHYPIIQWKEQVVGGCGQEVERKFLHFAIAVSAELNFFYDKT
jgi:hypothetical protein